jgi:hypothetical protein
MLENQTCRRAMGQGATILIGETALGGADAAAARNDRTLSSLSQFAG